MQVKDILYRDLISVSEDTSVRDLLRLFILNRISIVPIVNEFDEYVGCISDKNILDSAIPAYMSSMVDTSFIPDFGIFEEHLEKILDKLVVDILPKDYPVAKLTDSVTHVASVITKAGVREVPVVEDGMLIGKVHQVDILASCIKK